MRTPQNAIAGMALGAMLVSGCLPDPANPNNPNPTSLPATSRPLVQMSPDQITQKVRKIIVEQLGVEESKVVPGARFVADLGADELDQVELVMAFEEAFDLEIPDQEAEKMVTVKDATDYIIRQVTHPKT